MPALNRAMKSRVSIRIHHKARQSMYKPDGKHSVNLGKYRTSIMMMEDDGHMVHKWNEQWKYTPNIAKGSNDERWCGVTVFSSFKLGPDDGIMSAVRERVSAWDI